MMQLVRLEIIILLPAIVVYQMWKIRKMREIHPYVDIEIGVKLTPAEIKKHKFLSYVALDVLVILAFLGLLYATAALVM